MGLLLLYTDVRLNLVRCTLNVLVNDPSQVEATVLHVAVVLLAEDLGLSAQVVREGSEECYVRLAHRTIGSTRTSGGRVFWCLMVFHGIYPFWLCLSHS